MFDKKTIEDIELRNKKVIVRVDFNVPLDDQKNVTDDSRIRLSLPTISYLLENDAKVILMSHLGRPKGKVNEDMRLDPAAKKLEELLGKKVKKFDDIFSEEIKDYVESKMASGDIVLLENLRFDPEEKANGKEFAKRLASLADIYVNDAFGAAHRAHASVVGLADFLPAVAGFLLKKEVDTLSSLLEEPKRPFLAVLGGSKVSDKILVIRNLLGMVDSLIIGGGMSYTFLKAQGYEIGKSICEEDQIEYAKEMIELAKRNNVNLLLPVDLVVAKNFDKDAEKKTVSIEEIPSDWQGLDDGEKSVERFIKEVSQAGTIFWNGPIGVFEWQRFAEGTRRLTEAIMGSGAVTVAGGGDTLAAIKRFGDKERFSHVSSGGGAAMELLEGKVLPGVDALMDK